MELKPIVLRGAYNSLINADLSYFSENVVNATFKVKTYEAIALAADELQMKSEIFKNALAAAKFNEETSVITKNNAQKALMEALNQVANGLDYFAYYQEDSVNYIVGASMKAQRGRAAKRSTSNELDPPQITGIIPSNIIPGDVLVDITKIEGASNYGFEYSEDNEKWINGQYSSVTTATLKLPSRKDLWVRARAIGTRNRKSEFGVPVKTFVM
jgi:hypothetical protein